MRKQASGSLDRELFLWRPAVVEALAAQPQRPRRPLTRPPNACPNSQVLSKEKQKGLENKKKKLSKGKSSKLI